MEKSKPKKEKITQRKEHPEVVQTPIRSGIGNVLMLRFDAKGKELKDALDDICKVIDSYRYY